MEQDPIIDEYFTVIAQRDELAVLAETASEATRDLFAAGLTNADSKISELQENPKLVTYLTTIAAAALGQLQEIDSLDNIAQSGLLDPQLVEERRTSLMSSFEQDPHLQEALRFLGHTTLSKTVEVTVPVEPITAQEISKPVDKIIDAPEHVKEKLQLTYSQGAINVETTGKKVKTEKLYVKMLEILMSRPDEQLPPGEIWKAAGGPTGLRRNQIAHQYRLFKEWTKELTCRRRQVILDTGVKGRGSKYFLNPTFDLKLVKKEVTTVPNNPVRSTVTQEMPKAEITTEPRLKRRSPRSSHEQLPTHFPLSLYESALIAQFIQLNSKELEALELEPIPDELVSQLVNKIDEKQKANGFLEYSSIEEARQKVLITLEKFFQDDDLVLETIGSMSIKDHRFPLFEYLFRVEAKERWKLFEQLLTARRGTTFQVNAGRRAGWQVIAIRPRTFVDTEAGPVDLLGKTSEKPDLTEFVVGDEDKTALRPDPFADTTKPIAAGSVQPTPDLELTRATTLSKKQPEPVLPEQENTPEQKRIEKEMKTMFFEWAQTIVEFSLEDKSSRSVQGVFHWMTPSHVKNAAENGHISRHQSGKMSVRDILILNALKTYPEYFQKKRNTQDGINQTVINRLVRQAEDRYKQLMAEKQKNGLISN